MRTKMRDAANWDMGDYQRIIGVERRGNDLAVRFGDGAEAVIDADCRLQSGVSAADLDALTFSPYEIIVPTSAEPVEVPWSTIRALTDRQYATHLADVARDQARQIGLRIKELREHRGLTSKGLAERTGIAPQSLSRIEPGHRDVVYTTLQPILAAMGASPKDLVILSN